MCSDSWLEGRGEGKETIVQIRKVNGMTKADRQAKKKSILKLKLALPLFHRLIVVALVKELKVDLSGWPGAPQPEVDCVQRSIARYRGIVGHSIYGDTSFPGEPQLALLIHDSVDIAVEADWVGEVVANNLIKR